MKFTALVFGLIASVGLTVASPVLHERISPGKPLRLMSYNIRYDSKPDRISVQQTINSLPKGLPVQPSPYYGNPTERPWSQRRIAVANDILFPNVDIFGGQEILKRQVDDLQELLGDEWSHIGVGRDNGKEAGEYGPIFFKNSIKLVSWDTFWLSNTPFEPSRFPGAGSFRICTTARFSSENGNFTLLNSHLDNQSDEQRRVGASLMLHRSKFEAIKTGRPVFLTGDFNSATDGGAYRIITGQEAPAPINEAFKAKYSWSQAEELAFTLKDLAVEAPPRARSGNFATFTGFPGVSDTSLYSRIDYQLGGSTGSAWSVKSFHAGNTIDDNGLWHSDHRPIYSDIMVET